MSLTKPTILFVHGAWHNASCWDNIRGELSKYDYPSVAVQLPSSGGKPPVKSHLEDVAVVREELSKLVEKEGKEVIVVMHSYGGVVGSGSVYGFEKAARKEPGGVTQCIFLAAFLVPKGQSLLGMFDNQFPPYLEVHKEDPDYLIINTPHETFYNDMAVEVSQPWTSAMKPQSYASFQSKVEHVCWENDLTPCTYLMCEQDQGIFFPLQEKMVADAQADGHKWTIEKCSTAHSVWLSGVPTVVNLIRKTAGEEL